MLKKYRLTAVAACFLFSASCVYAGGLSSYFVEVKLENLVPGKTYSIKQEKNQALVIKNTTDDMTVDIGVEPEKPVDYNLVKGYEPIPDLSWIKIEKNFFKEVKPQQTIESDITINVPRNKKYYGKKYQVYIYSHTAGQGTFRVGLMSRILFTTTPSLPPRLIKVESRK